MFDADPPHKDKPQRSLLSLAPSATRDAPSGQDTRADAATFHRLARSRREAAPNPLLAALATQPVASSDQRRERDVGRADPAQPASLAEKLGSLFGRGRQAPEREVEPAPASFTQREEVAVYRPTIRQPLANQSREAPAADQFQGASALSSGDDQTWRPLIDPTAVISGVFNSKMLIFAMTVLGALIGVAIALSTPKKYEAVAELLIDPRDLQLVDRNLTEGGLPSDATLAIVENQVRVITSGSVLNKVVDKLKLDQDPEFNGDRQGFSIGQFIGSLRSLLSSGDSGGGGDRRRALAVEGLAKSLSVERSGKTFVVVIGAMTEDGEKSARIANTVTATFLETSGDLQSNTASRATGELTARLEELRKSLEAAERKVETYKAENDLIDAQGRLIGDDELLTLNQQLSVARAKTLELNAKAASTRSANVDAAISGVLPEEISSNGMVELRSQYASLKRESDRLSVQLGPRHPQRLAMDTELAGLRNEIANELRRVISSVQTELKRAVQLEQELAARLAQLKVRQGDVSDDLVTLRELERDATSKRAVYESYLLRARETGEQKDINTANMSVISQAFAPLEPTGPSRAVISATGMIVGFMAGLALGALRGAVNGLSATMQARRQRRRPTSGAVRAASMYLAAGPGPTPDGAAEASAAQDTPQPARPSSILSLIDKVRRSKPAPEPVASEPPATPPIPQPTEDAAMTPFAYPQQFAMPVQPQGQPAFHPQPGQPLYPQAPVYTPGYAYPQGYMPAAAQMPVYPQQHYAPPQPVYPYPQPMPQMMWQPGPMMAQPMAYHAPQPPMPAYAPQPVPAPQATAAQAERARSDIEEVRDSLREFREAIRDLAENRTRRRAY